MALRFNKLLRPYRSAETRELLAEAAVRTKSVGDRMVFMSHKTGDRDAEEKAEYIKRTHGVYVYMVEWDASVQGDSNELPETIMKAIRQSDGFLVNVIADIVTSMWIGYEIGGAHAMKKSRAKIMYIPVGRLPSVVRALDSIRSQSALDRWISRHVLQLGFSIDAAKRLAVDEPCWPPSFDIRGIDRDSSQWYHQDWRVIPNDDHTLLEIYKLHTELSERVAVLREDLSKLYASVVTSIVAASVIAHRISPDTRALWVLPALGMLLSVAWMLSLKSVTGRLSAKHLVLKELESKLPFDFLYRENTEFDRLGHPRRRLTAELLPWVFLVVCFAWLVVLVLAAICGDSVDTAPLAAGQ